MSVELPVAQADIFDLEAGKTGWRVSPVLTLQFMERPKPVAVFCGLQS